jgi:hypothetical protein
MPSTAAGNQYAHSFNKFNQFNTAASNAAIPSHSNKPAQVKQHQQQAPLVGYITPNLSAATAAAAAAVEAIVGGTPQPPHVHADPFGYEQSSGLAKSRSIKNEPLNAIVSVKNARASQGQPLMTYANNLNYAERTGSNDFSTAK